MYKVCIYIECRAGLAVSAFWLGLDRTKVQNGDKIRPVDSSLNVSREQIPVAIWSFVSFEGFDSKPPPAL